MIRVALAIAVFASATALSAECGAKVPAVKEYKQSEAVIVGTVVSAHQVPQSWDTLDGTDYVLHIDQKVKGKQSGEITIFSEHSEDGFDMQTGQRYLLFLNNNYQHWVVNKCGNSAPLDQAGPAIKALGHMLGND